MVSVPSPVYPIAAPKSKRELRRGPLPHIIEDGLVSCMGWGASPYVHAIIELRKDITRKGRSVLVNEPLLDSFLQCLEKNLPQSSRIM
jgi:hypothetical protein